MKIFDMPYHEMRELDSHPGVHIGGEYVVLEMSFFSHRIGDIRILDDTNLMGAYAENTRSSFYPPQMFEVVYGRIPSNWTVAISEDGTVEIGPAAFRGDFWDRYFRCNAEAKRIYEQQLATILAES